jgi:hypothetical protein
MTTSTTIPELATTDDSPHACDDGWVTIGQLVLDPETGEETEEYALYLCRRCADSRSPRPDSSGSYHQRGRRLFARAGALRGSGLYNAPGRVVSPHRTRRGLRFAPSRRCTGLGVVRT